MKIVEQHGGYYFERSVLQKKYSVWLKFGAETLNVFKSIPRNSDNKYFLPGIKFPKTLIEKIKCSLIVAFIRCRWNMTYSIAPNPKNLEDLLWLRSLGNDSR